MKSLKSPAPKILLRCQWAVSFQPLRVQNGSLEFRSNHSFRNGQSRAEKKLSVMGHLKRAPVVGCPGSGVPLESQDRNLSILAQDSWEYRPIRALDWQRVSYQRSEAHTNPCIAGNNRRESPSGGFDALVGNLIAREPRFSNQARRKTGHSRRGQSRPAHRQLPAKCASRGAEKPNLPADPDRAGAGQRWPGQSHAQVGRRRRGAHSASED